MNPTLEAYSTSSTTTQVQVDNQPLPNTGFDIVAALLAAVFLVAVGTMLRRLPSAL